MSVAVTIGELRGAIDKQIGWCYLLTTSDAGLPRILAIVPRWSADGATLDADISAGTAARVTAQPTITLLYPPATPEAMSLIVDGTGSIDGTMLAFTPEKAVMHRPAAAPGCA